MDEGATTSSVYSGAARTLSFDRWADWADGPMVGLCELVRSFVRTFIRSFVRSFRAAGVRQCSDGRVMRMTKTRQLLLSRCACYCTGERGRREACNNRRAQAETSQQGIGGRVCALLASRLVAVAGEASTHG